MYYHEAVIHMPTMEGGTLMSRRKIERDTANKGNVIDMKTGERVEQPSLPIICDRIRFYRKNQGMEQKAFAERTMISCLQR